MEEYVATLRRNNYPFLLLINPQFVGTVLCFLGTLLIVVDKFVPVHIFVNQHTKWHDINLAVLELAKFDKLNASGDQVGYMGEGSKGFSEVVEIVKYNKPNLRDKQIVGFVMNRPINVAGIPLCVVHTAFKDNNNAEPLTTEYIFYEWIKNAREKFFIKWGIFTIGLGFLFEIFGLILRGRKRKKCMTVLPLNYLKEIE